MKIKTAIIILIFLVFVVGSFLMYVNYIMKNNDQGLSTEVQESVEINQKNEEKVSDEEFVDSENITQEIPEERRLEIIEILKTNNSSTTKPAISAVESAEVKEKKVRSMVDVLLNK